MMSRKIGVIFCITLLASIIATLLVSAESLDSQSIKLTCEQAVEQRKLITLEFNTKTTIRIINRANQSFPIGIAIYQMPDELLKNQVLFDYNLTTIAPNSKINLTVQDPNCRYQLDVFCGELLQDFKKNKRYGDRLFGAKLSSTSRPFCNVTVPTNETNQTQDTINVTILIPSENQRFPFNNSIPLNYTIQGNASSCWYSLDNSPNIPLPQCHNTLFNTSQGTHTITVFANNSNNTVFSDTVSFNVDLSPPNVTLVSPPSNSTHPEGVIQFTYTATDVDPIISCTFWHNFTGTLMANTTQTNITSGISNSLSFNLTKGTYIWNVFCTDAFGHGAFAPNSNLIHIVRNETNVTQPPTNQTPPKTGGSTDFPKNKTFGRYSNKQDIERITWYIPAENTTQVLDLEPESKLTLQSTKKDYKPTQLGISPLLVLVMFMIAMVLILAALLISKALR